jgi:hypothetical protein
MTADPGTKTQSRYHALIERIFSRIDTPGAESLEFARHDLSSSAQELGIDLPKNLGDVVYSIRYRTPMPAAVLATQPAGFEWIIEGAGRSRYAFKLVRINRIAPNPSLLAVKVPDATPEIVRAYALSDEQALLAVVRYNRLIDVFLGIVTYSLQNHLRTTVRAIGQVEIDEIYVGLDRHGRQFVLPIQAKGGSDQLSVVQTKQDIACCAEKYPNLICRPISTQFLADDLIALFELALASGEVKVVEERHYRLVPARDIDAGDLAVYAQRG